MDKIYISQSIKLSSEDKIKGGLGDGKPDSDFDPVQLRKGIEVEFEHTNDRDKAKEIAKDHLTECSDYYDRLERLENECEFDQELKKKK